MFFGRHEDHYDFLIVLGKAEREKFEAVKHEFPLEIQQLYERERTLHDGKWLLIRVDDLKTLEAVKKLILIKKKPNRKPFPKENAVYGVSSWDMRCTGCDTTGCHCRSEGNELCEPLKCLHTEQLKTCFDCKKYPCGQATVGYKYLEHRNISADDVTWAILPYVPYQYEK
ncbi:DUF3788 family protein [Acetivibrio thermocellus]|uniref:DUF3788 domain-containing protein n=1 Tax=Acetivibrio thermocellus TaxID=1515 RepID=UPI0026811E5D